MQDRTIRSSSVSYVYISDVDGGMPPVSLPAIPIAATSSCIAVACTPEIDGRPRVVVGPLSDLDPTREPDFEGYLDTPHRQLVVSTIAEAAIVETDVLADRTRIAIWHSLPKWPPRIVVGWA